MASATATILAGVTLAEFLWPEFVEIDGCIFALPATSVSLRREITRRDVVERPWRDLDRTGAESLQNHVHILDLFEHDDLWDQRRATYRTRHKHFRAAERIGKIMGESWFAKLGRDFPRDQFRVYYTRNDNPIVRFHRVYPDETPWLNETERLEDLQREHLVVWDTLTNGAK